jgi:hypothetical protein
VHGNKKRVRLGDYGDNEPYNRALHDILRQMREGEESLYRLPYALHSLLKKDAVKSGSDDQ